ncbi:MAG: peroxiredoxin [Thermoplasmatota archaeon]
MSTGDPLEAVPVGDAAPDFSLQCTEGHHVRLSDFAGAPVVLYFYPEDHTLGCTMEARRFRDYFEAVSLHKAVILGVSRDNHENHCSFRDKNQLPFELLSDEDGAVHDLYGAWKKPLFGSGKKMRRCTYLIAPDGTVAKFYPRVNPAAHPAEVVQDLEAFVNEEWPPQASAAAL